MSLLWMLLTSGGTAPVGTVSLTAALELYLSASGASYSETVVARNGLLGYWRLGEASGALAEDISGNVRHGAYVGGVTYGVAGALTEVNANNTAVTFNGSSGKVTVASSALNLTAGPLSVLAYVKRGTGSSDAGIAGTTLATYTSGYHLTWDSAATIFFYIGNGSNSCSAALTDATSWHQVVGTWNGTSETDSMKLYVDGVLVDTTTSAVSPTIAGTAFEIGHANTFFNGSIDEVQVYNVVLTDDEVALDYATRTAGWYDVLDDVRSTVVCEYGIVGSTPADRIAGTGTLEFALDNSVNNAGGVLGYYSPLHANRRDGFNFNAPARLKLSFGGPPRYKFFGSLSDIVPTPGTHGERVVSCVALDWMDDAAQLPLPDLFAQLGQRPDELITTILDALPAIDQPVAREIGLGSETYDIALDGGVTGSQPKVREVLNQIALSELGYVYLKGDDATGGVLTFESRHNRAANPTIAITLDDTDILVDGVSVPGSRDEIYSSAQVLIRPTRIDAAATTVLFSLQTTHTLIEAGATNDTIFGAYRDPGNNDLIGGTAMVVPVATTDYTMNALEDGTGTDLTANFFVFANYTGIGLNYIISNTGAEAGYVTKLQARGKGIYRYVLPIEKAIPNSFGNRQFVLDMPFQNSVNTAADVASYLVQQLTNPIAHVPSVRFLANTNALLMNAAVRLEPGNRIALSETLTGVSGEFTINSVRLELERSRHLWCTWGLEPASAQRYWLWGIAGASEWGQTTVYGF